MGNTCKPMAVSFQCMTKFTTKKKKKNHPHTTLFLAQHSVSISMTPSSGPKYTPVLHHNPHLFPPYLILIWGFPDGSEVKASACNMEDLSSIPGSGRSPGGGNGNPLQYSCLENPMDGGAWWATVHGVTESHTRLSDIWVWVWG